MSRPPWPGSAGALAAAALLVCLGAAAQPKDDVAAELNARRLIGTAHYENGDFRPAVEQFRRCVELAADSAADRFNLALVLTRAEKYPEALELLKAAQRLDPDLTAVHYLRGIIFKRQNQFPQAIESLKRVASSDRRCWGTHYNLGVCYKNTRAFDAAQAAFTAAVRIDPNHPSAYYQLITLARRTGDVEGAKRYAEIFKRVNETVEQVQKTPEALERSRYSDIIRPPRLTEDPTGEGPPSVRFVEVTAAAGLQTEPSPPPEPLLGRLSRKDYDQDRIAKRYLPAVGGAVTLGDCDGDGDLDVYVVHCSADPKASANRLWRNQGKGRFAEVTTEAGVGDAGMGLSAVFGDYDNDRHTDLYVVNYGPNVLYRNRGDGTFADVSRQARADEPQFGRRAAFLDYDHDNDLDLLVVNDVELAEPPESRQFSLPGDFSGQINTLLRNNGDGTFLDQTDEAGLLVDCSQSRDLVFADFDGDHDVDLLIGNADAPSLLFANARLGRFTGGGSFSPPLKRPVTAVAEADFDRDGDPDLLLAVGRALYLYTNGGNADFKGKPLPLPEGLAAAGVQRIKVFDCHNDGRLDVLLPATDGRSLYLFAGIPGGGFGNVDFPEGLNRPGGPIADLATGDLDGDGAQDVLLLTRDRGLRLLRNDSGAKQHWLDVELVGDRVNRSGYGATVEIAVGGHYQKQTVRGGRIHFGLGGLEAVDVVRVTWPNGIAQNVVRPPLDRPLKIVEKVRTSVSCAMLWAHNGTRFELVNEILGIGPLGVPMAPGVYHPPDCTELTKIEADQLVPREGRYELRLTEELREITYADRITLRVVDHPAGLEIVPNEMFTAPPFPQDKLFAVEDARPAAAAVDDRGADVLPLVRRRDGRYPTFPLTRYDGLARPHAITLDLGDLSGAEQIVLCLDGWIYWAESSTVMAVAQDPRYRFEPLSLQVRDREGRWQTAIESVGLPTSKGLVVPVELTGRFPGDDYHVRLSTNMCVYFDRIFVSTSDRAELCRVTELPVDRADLRYRGFARLTRDRLGLERFDYADPSPCGPWDPPRGMYTRYGEVTGLLSAADDKFVIFGPGDELAMRFDGRRLPGLPEGWVRDFVFYANGWVKDGDLNTALSEQVGPLPFHGMSAYPYPAAEHYPQTPELRRYLRTYNTRPNAATTGRLYGR